MNAHPKITATTASADLHWSLDVDIEPGSVEDRPVPYSRSGATYRPARIRLVFRAGTRDTGVDRLTLDSGVLAALQPDITLSALTISGPRITSTGKISIQDYAERFYGNAASAPDWARFIVTATLNTLHGN